MLGSNPSTKLPPPDSRPSTAAFDRRTFFKWAGAAGASVGLAEVAGASHSSRSVVLHAGPTTFSAEQAASRFLAQCTFGGDRSLIEEVADRGIEAWLEDQLSLEPSFFLERIWEVEDELPEGDEAIAAFDWVWWQRAMTAPDQVRQRVAFALSEIFVISRRNDEIFDFPAAVGSYQDVLLRHAFGSFRELLLEVALHPCMGIYLCHLNNRRSDPATQRFPDENFAREVMQLFSIGLFELEPDGTLKLDSAGRPIPTYGNAQITELAKVFTGLTCAPEEPEDPIFFGECENLWDPMVMYEPEHEPGPKRLLRGFVVPAGQSGMEDIEAAIDHLFHHPNVGPFIGRQLIQRLVTSNPSPSYVRRVAAVFADNGFGERGDLEAVIRAVLLDPEARDPGRIGDPTFGKVREPFLRWVHLGRAFHATSESGRFRHFGAEGFEDRESVDELTSLSQYPFFSPSVFNFFSPGHRPAGPAGEAGLVAPEMEIIHSFTAIAGINLVDRAVLEEFYLADEDEDVFLDLEGEIGIEDPVELVDHLDLLLTYGLLSPASRRAILEAIRPLEDAEDRARLAIYLLSISPDYAVQR